MKEYIEIIEGIGYDGEGVCRINGKVVFVPYALRGERVKLEIVKVKSSFSKAKLLNVIEASDEREIPPCPYYGRCGGCSYQHTNYQNELKIKKELLSNQMKKVGYNGQINVHPSRQEYAYRNKIKLFVGQEGLSLKKEENLCHIDKCMLVSDEVNEAIVKIDKFIRKHIDVFDEVTIREENKQIIVVFDKIKDEEIDYQGIFLVLGRNVGIFESFKGFISHIMGISELEREEMGLKCHFSPKSFHQVNKFLFEELYEEVLKNIVGERVVNCYSGAGLLSGIIAQQHEVVGIELGENEHNDAELLKKENNLTNLKNLQGDCGVLLNGLNCDTLITDPPRKGMSKEVVDAINEMKCKRVIYVSCDSATMVRDIGRLKNYIVKDVSLFDMFARTGEYETLAILEREGIWK